MKNLLFLCIGLFILSSCGKDELEFPSTYTYSGFSLKTSGLYELDENRDFIAISEINGFNLSELDNSVRAELDEEEQDYFAFISTIEFTSETEVTVTSTEEPTEVITITYSRDGDDLIFNADETVGLMFADGVCRQNRNMFTGLFTI